MKFFCEKAVLLEAVNICSRAVSSKSAVSVLEGLLITADERITICGYNLKTGIKCSFSADGINPGAVVLNARLFGDIVRKMPDENLEINVNDKQVVTIRCAITEFNIAGLLSEEFPDLPKVEKGKCISIPQKTLKSMIAQTIFAVSDNENKPIHTGTLFSIEENLLRLISVDGYRLAMRTENISRNSDEKHEFVVPGEALREIERILPESEDEVLIYPDAKHILFNINNTTITSRLLEGEFLNYKSAIPSEAEVKYKANVRSMLASIERMSLIISEKLKNPVRCLFEDNLLKISCVTALGKAYDEIKIDGTSEGIEIGFNNRYLMDALRACPDEEINIELKSPLTPCVMKPVDNESFLFLVLPVRLRANEK